MSLQPDSTSTVDAAQTVPPTTDAPAPFNKPTADLILRSSDGMNFRVRKAFLAEASPVFEDMFTLPAPQNPAGSLPVVPMTEDSRTLEGLLRLCYPASEMPLRTLDQAVTLLDAAKKYAMDSALNFLGERLVSFAERSPIQVYAIAVRHQLPDKVIKAALNACLNLIAPTAKLKRVVDFQHISASAYLSFLDYRDRCAVAIDVSVFGDSTWIDSNRWCWLTCTNDLCQVHVTHGPVTFKDNIYKSPRAWWFQLHMSCCRNGLRSRPCGKALELIFFNYAAAALSEAAKCSHCGPRSVADLEEFMVILVAKIDDVVAQVETDIVW
ncbi:uncharacterized protein B0H18DRAFT_990190 [Fomitopsis serialis]|uniref:uncharacterized protein n=1 Tax=Fomitopsis serialis TaxID=139415 RepID=UPI0020077BFE|nr:uncharacterized protein B0H18DRAFT_990190 [Neoantrodia serialis]KAH9931599.1 hypothetical protein B0H18DRAFT_990190 [Neoantrodia serialis]